MKPTLEPRTLRPLASLAVLALLVTAACSGETQTAVRLDVRYEAGWRLDGFEMKVGDMLDRGAPAASVRVVVPDAWAGQSLMIRLDGLSAGERVAYGEVEVSPIAGTEIRGLLVLARLPCGAWCTAGATACNGDAVVVCEQRDEDQCMEWSDAAPCGATAPYCSLGVCDARCVDECVIGETRCAGPGEVHACGNADSDPCTDWLAPVACDAGTTCANGACTTVCQDECDPGQVRCDGNARATCGDLDLDGCLEWGPPVACPSGQSCNGDQCTTMCTDDCTASSCAGDTFTRCGQFDFDPCMDRSPGTSCVPADPCRTGECLPSGCHDEPKICDQPDAPMCIDAMTLRTFMAAGTCSAGTCSYPHADTTCASGCADGACVGACAGQMCQGELVSSPPENWTVNLVYADATHVYWGEAPTEGTAPGVLFRMESAGGAREVLASKTPWSVHTDATHIYWTDVLGLRRRARSGGLPETVVPPSTGVQGSPLVVAVDATHIYWAASGGNGQILRRAKTGTTPELLVEFENATDVVLDATHVYWIAPSAGGLSNQVKRRAKAGGAIEMIASGLSQYSKLEVDDTNVYWTTQGLFPFGTQGVKRQPKTPGASAETLEANQDFACGLAADGTSAYWTYNDGLRRRHKTGATTEDLGGILTIGLDRALAVNATHVFLANGTLKRVSRCACGF